MTKRGRRARTGMRARDGRRQPVSKPNQTETTPVLVRMPRVVADTLTLHAEAVGMSRNAVVVDVLTAWLDDTYADSERERIADQVRQAVIVAMGGA